MLITRPCPHCHKEWSVELDANQIERLLLGEPAISVLNDGSKAEFFITGICSTCWDELFKNEEE